MADFIFRVDNVQLNDAQQQKIASAIQGAVLTELAKLDLHGDQGKAKPGAPAPDGPSYLYRPILWNGGLLLKAEELAAAASSNLTVSNTAAADRTKTAA
jgi:hypothetical protein